MLTASKHFTPILGIDIHIVTIPPGVPTPLPHPYIGMVMDPANYIPFVGSTVNVNKVPRGTTFTSGMLGIMKHIPMGGPFVMMPTIGHDQYGFFGGMKTKAEGELMSAEGFMCMTCNDIGMPLSLTPGKKMKPIPSLYLPSSSSIPMPTGPPVIVGGPYVPDLMGLLMSIVMSFGMGALMKGAGKALKKVGAAMKKGLTAVNKKLKKGSKLKKMLCKWGFEPVNLVTGEVLYEGVDFELPGPIPIQWERSWYSFSEYKGSLGHGQQLCYDLPLIEDAKSGELAVMLPDGRAVGFEAIAIDDEEYMRSEKLTLKRNYDGYELFHHESRHRYMYRRVNGETFKPYTLKNEQGFHIDFFYNGQGYLNEMRDSVGRQIKLKLDDAGRIVSVQVHHRDQVWEPVSYGYNESGDLTHISDALGKSTVMEFEEHLMIKKTDRNGQAFYWEYDARKRCTHTWGDGGILEGWLEYHDGYNLVTNSLGEVSTYYFDENTLCTQIKDPLGNSKFFEYTEYFELYREIDEEGDLTGYTYDERGNRTGIYFPDGSERLFFHDEDDRVSMVVDGEGKTTVFRHDEKGRLVTVIAPNNSVTAFGYNESGQLADVRDGKKAHTLLRYDSDNNLCEVQPPEGAPSIWGYDAWGNCIFSRQGNQKSQSFEYDQMGRVTLVRLPDNNTIKLKYNAYQQVIEVLDHHHQVNYDYTPMGSLKTRVENGVAVQFAYDTEEQLTGLRNEHSESYTFSRNPRGEIIQECGFDGITRNFNRDRSGKVIRVDRPDEKWTEYEYDLSGRITRAEHSDGTWEAYSYDRNGLLVEAVNANSQVFFKRDVIGRIVEEIQDGHQVLSQYDNNGQRIQISSSLGALIDIERNASGYVEGLSAQTEDSESWEAKISRNGLGQEVERVLTGGVYCKMEYDLAGMPIAQTVTSSQRLHRKRIYQWDANSRLKKMVDSLAGGMVVYDHDAFGNLASAQYEDGSLDYKLPDEVGNLFKSKGRNDRRYGKGGRLLECPEYRYDYDAEGNLKKKIGKNKNGNWSYEWLSNGMLSEVQRPDGRQVRFEYDALGRRTVKAFAGKLTRWVWDGNVPLHEWTYLEEERPRLFVDDLGEITWSHVEPVNAELLITWVFDDGQFSPAAKLVGKERYSIVTDYLGTPVQMYNASGQLTWDAEYDIYGNVRTLRKGSLNECPFRYPGQYADAETGLYYNRFRYYDPDVGSYVSQDPIGLAGNNPNFYGYVFDSGSQVDFFGLSCGKNAKKMTVDEIGEFLGSSNWHKNGAKTKFLKRFKKLMRGDSNADFYVDKLSREVLLLTNRKKIWVPTGDFF